MPNKPKPPDSRYQQIREVILKSRPQEVSDKPDEKFIAEKSDLENARHKAQITGLRQDISERKKYANRCYWIVVIWLVVIATVIFLQGFKICGFALATEIIIALIGGTTTGVVGIFLIVTRYLFSNRK